MDLLNDYSSDEGDAPSGSPAAVTRSTAAFPPTKIASPKAPVAKAFPLARRLAPEPTRDTELSKRCSAGRRAVRKAILERRRKNEPEPRDAERYA